MLTASEREAQWNTVARQVHELIDLAGVTRGGIVVTIRNLPVIEDSITLTDHGFDMQVAVHDEDIRSVKMDISSHYDGTPMVFVSLTLAPMSRREREDQRER